METLGVELIFRQYSFSQITLLYSILSQCVFHMNTEVSNQSVNPFSVARD